MRVAVMIGDVAEYKFHQIREDLITISSQRVRVSHGDLNACKQRHGVWGGVCRVVCLHHTVDHWVIERSRYQQGACISQAQALRHLETVHVLDGKIAFN